MKHSAKKGLSLFFLLLLLVNLANTAYAVNPSITYKSLSDGFEIQPGSEYTASDLFNNFKDVMPGDVLTEEITFTNAATDLEFVMLYLRAEAHDEMSNPLTYSESFENADGKDQANIDGQRDETVATMSDFLSQLSMKVWNGTELIYSAAPSEPDGLSMNKLLGTFYPGDTATLKVELSVPKDLDNIYANRVGEVDWIFHVQAYEIQANIETQLSVHKVWSDGNANHPKDSITVNLLKDGTFEKAQVLNAENGWTYTFDQLIEGPVWTAVEADVPAGYSASYQTLGNITTITNTKDTPPVTGDPLDITVKKVWSSDDPETRPSFVTVTLYNGETPYQSVRLNKENNWSYTWKKDSALGNWQVFETNIPKGYTPSYHVKAKVVTITNNKTLIQTGQLNWPIMVLGGAGLIFASFGGIMLTKKKKSHHV